MICQKRSLGVNENAAFILDQNTCRICHPFDLQADNIEGSLKRSNKVRFYKCTRNDDALLLLTEFHVVKERNNVISGIASSPIAGKWYEREAELEHLLALVRKTSEHIEAKKQRKNYVRQIYFILTLQKSKKYYYKLPEIETFSLTYSHKVVSYSG